MLGQESAASLARGTEGKAPTSQDSAAQAAGGHVSCAACKRARGYSTPCPYCREPGDLQREAVQRETKSIDVHERIARALERIAAALEAHKPPEGRSDG
jgi:hypothetical protein